jgi:hypothetical protein
MTKYCTCNTIKNYTEVFKLSPPYGWIIEWIEFTDEKGYKQIHRFGLAISYCPVCGLKLKTEDDNFDDGD